LDFPFADVSAGDDRSTVLKEAADNDRAGSAGESAQLFQRIVAQPGPIRQSDADEESPFAVDC
jgi:hypothetical protein